MARLRLSNDGLVGAELSRCPDQSASIDWRSTCLFGMARMARRGHRIGEA